MTHTQFAEQNKPKPSFLSRLLDIFFVVTACSGLLRFYGASLQKDPLVQFGQKPWLVWYLTAAGLTTAVLNLTAFICFKRRSNRRVAAAWMAVTGSILVYWIERFALWAPDQRGGNLVFMILYHLVCLIVLGEYTITERKRMQNEHGS
jgi:hypothetical protein